MFFPKITPMSDQKKDWKYYLIRVVVILAIFLLGGYLAFQIVMGALLNPLS